MCRESMLADLDVVDCLGEYYIHAKDLRSLTDFNKVSALAAYSAWRSFSGWHPIVNGEGSDALTASQLKSDWGLETGPKHQALTTAEVYHIRITVSVT